MTWLMVLFLLLAAHAAFDYALQGDTVAINKNPNAKTPLQEFVPWYYWLGSHALMHGGAVSLVFFLLFANVSATVFVLAFWLGLAETVCHFTIDLLKCYKFFSIHIDQLLHLVCKVAWVLVFFYSL